MDKIKVIAVVMLLMMALTMLFGCTGVTDDNNAPKVTTQGEANNALNDASTDLSGVKGTLDDVEDALTK